MTITAPITGQDVLRIHTEVWNMPTLVIEHPEVMDWLVARIEVHFGMVGEVIIVPKDGSGVLVFNEVYDVREAVKRWLESVVVHQIRIPA